MKIGPQNSLKSPAGICLSWHVPATYLLIQSAVATGRLGVFGCPKLRTRFPPKNLIIPVSKRDIIGAAVPVARRSNPMAKGWFRRKKGKLVYCYYNANGQEP